MKKNPVNLNNKKTITDVSNDVASIHDAYFHWLAIL